MKLNGWGAAWRMATWRQRARCLTADDDLFFPAQNDTTSTPAAKAICRACPVRVECLTWAIEWREVGIWGGTTDTDRRTVRRWWRRDRPRALRAAAEAVQPPKATDDDNDERTRHEPHEAA